MNELGKKRKAVGDVIEKMVEDDIILDVFERLLKSGNLFVFCSSTGMIIGVEDGLSVNKNGFDIQINMPGSWTI
jgi:hypothetical protein